MANVILSPYMDMPVPVVGVDFGPDWANNINACLSILDGHNHSLGTGNQVTPAGLNINSDLPINNNNLTMIRSVRFTPQGTALSLPADVGCLYEAGVDLYYNDGAGNQVRITQGGSVTGASGTITGLPSGTASASYAAGTFKFQSATNTAATIDAGSYIFRNLTPSSFGVTVMPVNSLGADYSLTLPTIPLVQSIMALDTAGNITAPYTVDNSTIEIATNVIQVKNLGITAAKLAANSVTFPKIDTTTVSIGRLTNKVVFSSAGSTTWTAPANVTEIELEIWSGGGGGGNGVVNGGAGGNSGGRLIQRYTVVPATVYNLTVGAGGTVTAAGGSSIFDIITVAGGRPGANADGGGNPGVNSANPYYGGGLESVGGSGGPNNTNGSVGTPSQWAAGGSGGTQTGHGGGGGGGAGIGAGANGGNTGAGGASAAAGSAAGGGGGGGDSATGGSGGSGQITIYY